MGLILLAILATALVFSSIIIRTGRKLGLVGFSGGQ